MIVLPVRPENLQMLANERAIRALLERKPQPVPKLPVLPVMHALPVSTVLLKRTQSVQNAHTVFINQLKEHRIAFHACVSTFRINIVMYCSVCPCDFFY